MMAEEEAGRWRRLLRILGIRNGVRTLEDVEKLVAEIRARRQALRRVRERMERQARRAEKKTKEAGDAAG